MVHQAWHATATGLLIADLRVRQPFIPFTRNGCGSSAQTRAAGIPRVFASAQISTVDQGAGAMIGKQLEQHGMGHLTIKNHYAFDPLLKRFDRRLHFGDHTP
jgi:hypothetical protein